MAKKTENNESLTTRITKIFTQQSWFGGHKSGFSAALYVAMFLLTLLLFIFLFKTVMVLFSTTESDKGQQQRTSGKVSSETQDASGQQSQAVPTEDSTKTPPAKYRIVYGEGGIRGDDGLYLFVLTDPVDLVKDDFKSRVESIVRSMVKSNGSKITIDIFDNREALDIQYQVWVLKTMNEQLGKEQEALVERHQIASFEGGTVLGPSENTIILFPNATNKTPEVSDLAITYEFNPQS